MQLKTLVRPKTAPALDLKARKAGIGGSDVAAILGLSPFKTALDVYRDKTSDAADESPLSEAMYWGLVDESGILDRFEAETGFKTLRDTGTVASPDKPWMLASVDALAETPEGRAVVECKSCNERTAPLWEDGEAPVYYQTQIQWYMRCLGLQRGYFAVRFSSPKFMILRVERDDETIDRVEEIVDDFWTNRVLARVAPDEEQLVDVGQEIARQLTKNYVEIGSDAVAMAALEAYRDAKDRAKLAADAEEAAKKTLAELIGPNEGIMVNGERAVSYKEQTASRFDSAAFKKANPDEFSKFQKESKFRVLRLLKGGK